MAEKKIKNAVATKTNNAVAQKKTMKDYVQQMLDAGEIQKALPSVITPERFTRIVLSALSSTPELNNCSRESFLGAMMTAAQLGVEPNTPLGQAYLIPYNNRKKGVTECQFQLGYKGLIDLAYRSGVKTIQVHEVFENDTFEYEYGLDPKLVHKPALTDRGSVVAYYAIFETAEGGTGFEIMSREDILKHAKAYSKSFGSGPWQTDFDAMAKKGLALDTPIPTPSGWTTMGDVQVGDEVFDMNGNPTKVIAVSEVKHLPCFKVTFSNGGSVICDDEHRWIVGSGTNARRDVNTKGWSVETVNAIYEMKSNGVPVITPVPETLNLPEADLPVDPWLLGYWLGDGSSSAASISCNEDWSRDVVERINSQTPYTVENVSHDKRTKAVQINVRDGFKVALRDLGVLGNKHVPDIYFRASAKQRLALLQGLMDSDGCVEKNRGRAKFCSTNKGLRDAVFELATSLGEVCNTHEGYSKGFGKTTLAYWVEWKPANNFPFTLTHHTEKTKEREVIPYLSIKSVEKVDSVPTKCIAVASDSKSYMCGRGFYVTHNTVLKRVLKYAPLRTDFVRAVESDESVREIHEEHGQYENMDWGSTSFVHAEYEVSEEMDPYDLAEGELPLDKAWAETKEDNPFGDDKDA